MTIHPTELYSDRSGNATVSSLQFPGDLNHHISGAAESTTDTAKERHGAGVTDEESRVESRVGVTGVASRVKLAV